MKHSSKSVFSNWQVKILCFIAAVFVYVVVAFGIQERRTVTLPLKVIMPEGFVPTSVVPSEADIIISGSEEVIYMIEISNYSLSVDFSRVNSEGVASAPIDINNGDLDSYVNLSGVNVYTNPSYVKIYFEKSSDGQK